MKYNNIFQHFDLFALCSVWSNSLDDARCSTDEQRKTAEEIHRCCHFKHCLSSWFRPISFDADLFSVQTCYRWILKGI